MDDLLSMLGSVLDAPRSAVWDYGINPLQKALGVTTGDVHNTSELLAGLGMDPESLGTKALGFAGDVATDPLTYLGGYLGSKAGQALFGKLGPMHGADAAKLAGLAIPEEAAARGGTGMIEQALAHPDASRILNEIPKGSTFEGAGAESLALRTPEGDVLKLSPFDQGSAINYPSAPELNTPTRRQFFGNLEVSRVPGASDVGSQALFDTHAPQLREGLGRQGVDLFDFKPEDMGLVGGRPKVLDLGGTDLMSGAGGQVLPIAGRATSPYLLGGLSAGVAGPQSSRLLSMLGG